MSVPVLGIIDAQRGFMPEQEGQRLHARGFGELPVPHGERIVPNVNKLLGLFAAQGYHTFTTQDWHPDRTAHFSREPNFTTTWPVHCVRGTEGAELHPNIELPLMNVAFLKGMEPLQRGEDDTSYSAFYAKDTAAFHTLPEWLHQTKATHIYLGGLALDYCVGKSALDIRRKLGLEVSIVSDATAGITPESSRAMLRELERAGVYTTSTRQVMHAIQSFAHGGRGGRL